MVASSILVASWKFFLETRLDLLNFLPKTFLKPLFLITISSLGAFLSLSYVGFNLFFLVTQFASLPIFLFFMAILLIVAQGQAIWPQFLVFPFHLLYLYRGLVLRHYWFIHFVLQQVFQNYHVLNIFQ